MMMAQAIRTRMVSPPFVGLFWDSPYSVLPEMFVTLWPQWRDFVPPIRTAPVSKNLSASRDMFLIYIIFFTGLDSFEGAAPEPTISKTSEGP